MNEKAERIINVIKEVIDDPDVQAGYPDANGNTNVTWCNRALHRMLVQLNGKVDQLLDLRGIGWTDANTMVKNARAYLQRLTDPALAQAKANVGELVAVVAHNDKGSGHVALVCPNDDTNTFATVKSISDVLVGQAGAKCGIMPLREGFAHLTPAAEFYLVPEVSGCGA